MKMECIFLKEKKVSRIYFTKDNDEHFNLNIERDFSDYIFQEILNIFKISNKTTKSIHEVVHNINGKDYKIIGAFSALSGKSTDVTLKFIS